VRKTVKKDLIAFALPGLIVFSAGLTVSAWDLVKQQSLDLLSVQGIVGIALVVTGLIIRVVAAVTLRRFYSATLITRSDHQLITHGVYRLVRHPIYLGALVSVIGMPVAASSLYGLLIMLILIPIILNRIRMEERMLIGEFGNAYRAYRRTTKKLIPFIY
jgi:protein-S-isoprenylcysteine O-methyltransferase Ste14